MAVAGSLHAATLISLDEALALAFPGDRTARETLFLTDAQLAAAAAASGREGQGALVTRFTATREGAVTGFAYLDTHRVRTLPETVLVVVTPAGTVARVEVVAFREPLDYLPPKPWYAQVEGRALDAELELKRAIRPVTGATLTARATTDAVRRVLALHQVLTTTAVGAE